MDERTLARINLFGILNSLECLCEIDDEAKKLAQFKNKKKISLRFDVADCGSETLIFENGRCKVFKEKRYANIICKLLSPAHFNGMINGNKNPLPVKGFTLIKFLTENFIGLTEILTKYLRASADDLTNEKFFVKSTSLMFYLIMNAISEIANYDDLGRVTAQRMCDGIINVSIKGGPQVMLQIKNHKFKTIIGYSDTSLASMEFGSFKTARGLFNGECDSMTCLARGDLIISGFVPLLDDLNKLLFRVAGYLA